MVGTPAAEANAALAAAPLRAASRGFLVALFAAGLLWRGWISVLTPLPSEDGVNYLWMAEQFAAGEPSRAFSEVFPPLTSLLIAGPVALGLEPFRAGQLVLALAGALALVFLVRGAEVVLPGRGRCAGCFALFAPLPVRFGAEIYSEPLFVMLTAAAIWAGLRGALGWLGWAAGLAFWVRPEAAVLVVAFGLVRPRAAWRALLPFALCAVALTVWRGALGHGFAPLGELFDMVEERSVTGRGDVAAGLRQLAGNVIDLPWLWVEAFGLVGLLAVWGMLRGPRRGQAALYWTLLLGVVVICAFLARRRFLIAWFAAVSPIAVAGFQSLPKKLRSPVFWLVLVSSAWLSLRTMDVNRRAERAVGEFLAEHLQPGDGLVSDMTRVVYFAGRRPLPPKPFGAEELIELGRDPAARVIVLGSGRAAAPVVEAALADTFERASLPPDLVRGAADRGILVLTRR